MAKKSKIVPLPGTFMITAIVGFIVSIYMVKDLTWRFTMLIIFSVMFIASYISMMQGPVIERNIKK